MTVLPPLPKKSMSQLACRLRGQLCVVVGLMSERWATWVSREGEQGKERYGWKGSRTFAGLSKSLIWRGAPLFCIKCFAVNF